jgi:hypothetical protein
MTVTTFAASGIPQLYTVPSGVTFVTIECDGAAGAPSANAGGLGGYAKGKLIVAPGTVLVVHAGNIGSGTSGGYPGGGNAGAVHGGGGGGYSDVRTSANTYAGTLIAAGGGGGSGFGSGGTVDCTGGYGGGTSGGSGHGGPGAGAGAGATNVAGFATSQGGSSAGTGGGGGGGWWGGQAGGNGGAGGGSGHISSSIIGGTMLNGVRGGSGQVVITAVNTAPLAPTPVLPAANSYIFASDDNLLTWVFNDNDPGDYQSRADFRCKKAGDVSWTTLTAVASTWTSYLLPANTWVTGFQYELQYATYDAAGLVSPWSASRFLNTITNAPAPTITEPASGDNLFTSPYPLTWTLPAGYAQDAYLAQRTDTSDGSGTVYWTSGTVLGAALTVNVPLDASAGRTDWFRISFRSNGHWSNWASVNAVTQLSPPMTPIVTAFQP